MTNYPTSLSDSQWQVIKDFLGKPRKRKHGLREILNAVLYVVKTGCQWRMLPRDFAKWELIYYYYRQWVEAEVFDKVLDRLRSKVRVGNGQGARPTLGIMDSQSV